MKKSILTILSVLLILINLNYAQVLESTGSQSSGSSGGGSTSSKKKTNLLGTDVPFFDPGNENLTWDGKIWNIGNNRLIQARFEKYLNAPSEDSVNDRRYRRQLREILNQLSPTVVKARKRRKPNIEGAFIILPKASEHPIDAYLCESIANGVYACLLAKGLDRRIKKANKRLYKQMKDSLRNAIINTDDSTRMHGSRRVGKGAVSITSRNFKVNNLKQDARAFADIHLMVESEVARKANLAKLQISEQQSRVELQALIIQLFMQRRFEHVIIACRFYRAIFQDGNSKINFKKGSDVEKSFSEGLGMNPTIATVDSLANEMIRDANEGVEAFKFLVTKGEIESASKRLFEAFSIGEYLTNLRTLPRGEKRKVLLFTQKSNQLINALEVKDFTFAEKLVEELQGLAKDFDHSKPLAAIETSRTVSAMHLAKAKNAAVSGDMEQVQKELQIATELWPRNPKLREVSELISNQADLQSQAKVDFDRLFAQKNYRAIYEDSPRFIAATIMDTKRSQTIKSVIESYKEIESAILRAEEVSRRGDKIGAWESIENAYKKYPSDIKLNEIRSSMTVEASHFVQMINKARSLEESEQYGSSLSWYLEARYEYLMSQFAREGIERLSNKMMIDEDS